MNNSMSQFPSVYSESPEDIGKEMVKIEDWYSETVNDKPYPNSMGGAAQCFGWGMYKTTAYGLIAKEGDTFRIGVRMDADQDWWCIFDNFKLTYYGGAPEAYQFWLSEMKKGATDYSSAVASKQYKDAYLAAYDVQVSNKDEAVAAMKAIQAAADAITELLIRI